MAEKIVDGEKGTGSGKEGGSSKTSLRSLLPHSNSKEATPSSPSQRSTGRFLRFLCLLVISIVQTVLALICVCIVCGHTNIYTQSISD